MLQHHTMTLKRRVDQWISNLGYCSRREVSAAISEGILCHRHQISIKAQDKVVAEDLLWNQQTLEAPHGLFVMYHKPVGLVCSHSTSEGPSIYEKLPPQWLRRNPALTSIGRLDKETSGLLLLTDQGHLVHQYTSPNYSCEKQYEITVEQVFQEDLTARFQSGTLLLRGESKPCSPAIYKQTSAHTATLIITEGRYHQVRRMFAALGYHITHLHRSRVGSYTLGSLTEGQYQPIHP
jgi:16S rRNA pseudouridine516 synthase